MLVRLNHKVHVLFRRQDLDMVKLEGKVVIVLDVLFATSTMVTALAHGATEVIPTLNEDHARAEARRLGQAALCTHGEAIHVWMRMMMRPELEQNRLGWLAPDLKYQTLAPHASAGVSHQPIF